MTGVGALLRLHLRRDRWMLLWWIAGTVLLYWSQAVGTRATYTTEAELAKAATALEDDPALVAMTGPARALDTIGGQVAWQAAAFGAIVLALMNMFLLGRHLRAEEESGRDELVRSSAVSRTAPLVAAVLLVVAADLVAGVLVAAALVGYGLPVGGSVALAVGLVGSALVLGAAALVAMQLTTSVRAAYGITGAVIAVAYVLRAVGDVSDGTLSWFSPIGWAQAMWPYSGDRWWPTLLFPPAAAALTALALALFHRRDVGSGLWSGRPGPAAGRLGAWSLAWRLQWGSVVGWSVGTFLMGLAYGSLGDSVGEVVGDGELARDVLGVAGRDVVDGFHATSLAMIALLACGFSVSSALQMRGDEVAGHADLLLSTSLPRRTWWASHVVVTLAGTTIAVLAGGLGLGLGFALTTGDGAATGRLVLDAATYVPAAWALAGLALALHGWLPRATVAAWAGVGVCAVVLFFGTLLDLPSAITDLSPFEALARVPAEPWSAGSFAAVLAATVLLGVGGLAGTTRRDLG